VPKAHSVILSEAKNPAILRFAASVQNDGLPFAEIPKGIPATGFAMIQCPDGISPECRREVAP
jgi:hypothetical protein